jgi:hypothetical protein
MIINSDRTNVFRLSHAQRPAWSDFVLAVANRKGVSYSTSLASSGSAGSIK